MTVYTDEACTNLATYAGAKVGKLVTDSNGKATIGTLPRGTYYLVETKAPDGYNMLSYDIVLNVGDKFTYSQANNAGNAPKECDVVNDGESTFTTYRFYVANSPGVELPSTGGSGTAAFLISGLTLAITSGAVLTSRCSRRKKD